MELSTKGTSSCIDEKEATSELGQTPDILYQDAYCDEVPQGSESVWQFSRKKSPAKQAHVALLGKVCEVLKQKDQKVSQMKIMVAEPGGSDCFDLWRLENWISVRNWDPQCKEHNQKIKKGSARHDHHP